jgi:NTP pyrophosphatase (non-canonical NTP hydrolase)
MSEIAELQRLIVEFSVSRGWANDPKDLAMSTASEAGEMMAVYRGLNKGEILVHKEWDNLRLECADVLWFLLRLCDAEGIDLAQDLRDKFAINAVRFPPKEGA